EPVQVCEGGDGAVLVSVIADSPDLHLIVVDLESLVVVGNSVTWETDHPPDIAQASVFRILEDDDVSSLQPGGHAGPYGVNSVRSVVPVPPLLHDQVS